MASSALLIGSCGTHQLKVESKSETQKKSISSTDNTPESDLNRNQMTFRSLASEANEALCSAISNYSLSEKPLSPFNITSDYPLCVPYWSKYKVDIKKFNVCGSNESSSSPNFQAKTRARLESRGFSAIGVDSRDARIEEIKNQKKKEITEKFELVRKQVSEVCCQKNDKCKAAMRKVDFEFCEASLATDTPDKCTFDADFELPEDQIKSMWASFRKYYQSIESSNSENTIVAIKSIIDPLFENSRGEFNAVFEGVITSDIPLSGKVILSPYVRVQNVSDPMANEDRFIENISHEIIHSCEIVKAQQMVLNGENNPKIALSATERLQRGYIQTTKKCETTSEIRQYHRELWSEVGESPELAKCVESVVDEAADSRNANSSEYCKGACHSIMLVESFSQAMELILFDRSREPTVYPIKACYELLDENHPLNVKILECVARHSNRFRSNFNSVFKCSEPS